MNKILVILFLFLINTPSYLLAQNKRKRDMMELPAYSPNKSEVMLWNKMYTVSFNKKHRIPNWVAWELNEVRIQGNIERCSIFFEDPRLKEEGIIIKDNAYHKSGYSRGHLCPAMDNKNSMEAMKESFYMSNVVPQLQGLNGGKWETLESRCGKWVKNYKKLYIVAGPIIGLRVNKRIGVGITVPKEFFKAILRKDKNTWRAIGYIFTQSNTMRLATIDEIEGKTGLNLFHNLPNNIQEKIESKIEPEHWQHWDR